MKSAGEGGVAVFDSAGKYGAGLALEVIGQGDYSVSLRDSYRIELEGCDHGI